MPSLGAASALVVLTGIRVVSSSTVVVLEYFQGADCTAEPWRVEKHDPYVFAVHNLGYNVTTCQRFGKEHQGANSMTFSVSEDGSQCLTNWFTDAECATSKETQVYAKGDCVNKKKATKEMSFRTTCTNDATKVPSGAWDSTCVSLEELKATYAKARSAKLQKKAPDDLCFGSCFAAPELRSVTNKESFDALFAADACAHSCDDAGKAQFQHFLISKGRFDCAFKTQERKKEVVTV
mmetsp:Transcript_61048/g.145456  ORF Transcript_61048/g.145456 Transcript_61048/m.145456 type:complete len:236 (+) Transcript_61048:69-776(+)